MADNITLADSEFDREMYSKGNPNSTKTQDELVAQMWPQEDPELMSLTEVSRMLIEKALKYIENK